MNTNNNYQFSKSAVGFFSFFSSTNVETKNVCPIAYNGLHKTSKGMREMNYRVTQQIERATMLKLPIQPLLVLCGVTARFY
jgi:hypothetical protein